MVLNKIHSVLLKAAIFGGALFAGLTIAVLVGDRYFGRGKSGDLGPDTFMFLLYVIGTPTLLLKQILGVSNAPADSFVSSNTFGVMVNAFLGAVLFMFLGAIWNSLMKADNKE